MTILKMNKKKKAPTALDMAKAIQELTGLDIKAEAAKCKGRNALLAQYKLSKIVLDALLLKVDFFPVQLIHELTGCIIAYKNIIQEIEKSKEAPTPTFER